MPSHKADGTGHKQSRQSDQPFHITGGKIATPVNGFANGITGTPPAPKLRGEPKHVGTGSFPTSSHGKNGGRGPLGAFGLNSKKGH